MPFAIHNIDIDDMSPAVGFIKKTVPLIKAVYKVYTRLVKYMSGTDIKTSGRYIVPSLGPKDVNKTYLVLLGATRHPASPLVF